MARACRDKGADGQRCRRAEGARLRRQRDFRGKSVLTSFLADARQKPLHTATEGTAQRSEDCQDSAERKRSAVPDCHKPGAKGLAGKHLPNEQKKSLPSLVPCMAAHAYTKGKEAFI